MPRVFDNIDQSLLPALRDTLAISTHADFCVGYFNLRGWRGLDELIEPWAGGENNRCRLLVGMQRPPFDELKLWLSQKEEGRVDQGTVKKLLTRFAENFNEQLTYGVPTDADEKGLRRLARQIRAGKVVVKLHLRHPLHAKLYLLHRQDPNNPITGFVGSSNLTFSGLSGQGELNVDVLDHDATGKLSKWFDDRWEDKWCVDISRELAEIIEQSWAREEPIKPYHIYLNIAYHLSAEARAGLTQFHLPRKFDEILFDFQKSAVKMAARHLTKRGGVLIGDVVGLGKTLMATALARMVEDDLGYETLIICPKNLESMWETYRTDYGLRGRVLPISQVVKELPALRPYSLVLIDESHNLRNREGRRYKSIREYIQSCNSKVILLSATPYNKQLTDLSNQLRLFVDETKDIGVRPERYIRKEFKGSVRDFETKKQCKVGTLQALEHSDEIDDWRELMRLYMVRRTRSFIVEHHTKKDRSARRYLLLANGQKAYFPIRQPRNISFELDKENRADQYAHLYSNEVVDLINSLNLPRYGLGNYILNQPALPPSSAEKKQLQDLGRAGKRLMGFCRTNLFKRLESSGHSFIQSIERHILRNYLYLHAIENGLEIPIGTLDAGGLDAGRFDEDIEDVSASDDEILFDSEISEVEVIDTTQDWHTRAAQVFRLYHTVYKKRYKWLRAGLFNTQLAADLLTDSAALQSVLARYGAWQPKSDTKLQALVNLLQNKHANEKVLIFTQFADTARYLGKQLNAEGVRQVAAVTGASQDPAQAAWRFSPVSNKKPLDNPDRELRVLIATDVLSEGQNLQDCSVVVNYDLPWAIIRLIQRAGRVDRIGQQADTIQCYSFIPADGVESIIRLRSRVRERLKQNAEVIGADEAFFEDDEEQAVLNLYAEKSGALDDTDDEVDLASYAWQIWKNATDQDETLKQIVSALPPVAYSSMAFHFETANHPLLPEEAASGGSLVYVKSPEGNDALAWMGQGNESITESQFTILKAAECVPDTPALPRDTNHHVRVAAGVSLLAEREKRIGGGLGKPSGPRARTYERLKRYADFVNDSLFKDAELYRVLDEIYQRPLLESAADIIMRLLKSGIADTDLADTVKSLGEEGRLCVSEDEIEAREPKIICSLGLIA